MKKITLVEVGPRDGFQNVKNMIPTEVKKKAIDMLVEANIKKMEITSFVSPKAIPQMSDSKEITEYCLEKYKDTDVKFFALVPNLRGAKDAYEAGLREVAYVISVSESHNKANVRRSTDESFKELEEIIKAYPDMKVDLDLATSFGCPFEGDIDEERVLSFIQRGIELGINDIVLCDTTGVSTPQKINSLLSKLDRFKGEDVTFEIHIHDTRNMGILNTIKAIENGIVTVQSTVGGLGGCPFAPGASGNTSSEDLIYVLKESGYETGINFEKLLECGKFLRANINGTFSGHQINIGDEKCKVQ